MSELQIILIVIGALIIAAVVTLNWWQERKFHQQLESSFAKAHGDVLLDETPASSPQVMEPSLDVTRLSSHDDMHDEPEFSIDGNVVAVEGAVEEQGQETIGNEENSQLIDGGVMVPSYATLDTPNGDGVGSETDVPAEKPEQHAEIKAIFDEVLGSVINQNQFKLESSATTAEKEGTQVEDASLSLPEMLHVPMDLIALFYLPVEATLGGVANAVDHLFEGYDKPLYIHVFTAGQQWIMLDRARLPSENAAMAVSKLTCSLQLADRAGAVSRGTLNRFQLAVTTLGLELNAHVEWQSVGDAMATATALDAFCIEVDKTMGFHLVHGEAGVFTGTKLRGLAESQGMVLESDGMFKYYDEGLAPPNKKILAFVMFNRDYNPFTPEMLKTNVIKSVSFQLDIPHIKHCAEAFNHMVRVAKQMETGLHAQLVDDNGKPIADMQIEKIRNQLKVIHAKLLVRGIVPGSDSALRLFS